MDMKRVRWKRRRTGGTEDGSKEKVSSRERLKVRVLFVRAQPFLRNFLLHTGKIAKNPGREKTPTFIPYSQPTASHNSLPAMKHKQRTDIYTKPNSEKRRNKRMNERKTETNECGVVVVVLKHI